MAIEGAELAQRLLRARKAAGLTQEAVAASLGLPRPAIGQIEKNSRSVSGIELDQMASLYGVGVADLLGGTSGGIALFRKDDLAELPEVAAALMEAVRIARELVTLERSAGLALPSLGSIAYDQPQPSSVQEAIAQGSQTAEAERRRLGLGDEAVAHLVDVLEDAGLRTTAIDMPEGIAGVMIFDEEVGTLVAVNKRDHVLRRTFSLAHEYAHALLDRAKGAHVTRVDAQSDLREVRANAFAASFLMPENRVRRRLQQLGKGATAQVELHDLVMLAHEFGVSRQAMLNRLRSLRVQSPKQIELLRERDAANGAAVQRLLELPEPDHAAERRRFEQRYARLAIEAHLKGAIDVARLLVHLTQNVGMSSKRADELARSLAAPAKSSKSRKRSDRSNKPRSRGRSTMARP